MLDFLRFRKLSHNAVRHCKKYSAENYENDKNGGNNSFSFGFFLFCSAPSVSCVKIGNFVRVLHTFFACNGCGLRNTGHLSGIPFKILIGTSLGFAAVHINTAVLFLPSAASAYIDIFT